MIDPAGGPYLFDTSGESWLARAGNAAATAWMRAYLAHAEIHVSAITVVERVRGYGLLWRKSAPGQRERIEAARIEYLGRGARVLPVDAAVAVIGGELMALVPNPPTPSRRTHRMVEARADRLARWRFDQMIAATALVSGMRLIHNNAADFEPLRTAVEQAPERFAGLGPLELARCTGLACA
ncbi:MAG: PIN domain-containing protein [Terriglobales bacterium]